MVRAQGGAVLVRYGTGPGRWGQGDFVAPDGAREDVEEHLRSWRARAGGGVGGEGR